MVIGLLLVGCPKGGATATPASSSVPSVVYTWAPGGSSPEPELLGSLMEQFFSVELLLSVGRSGDTATVVIATGDGQGQDACAATTTLSVPVAADGTFTADAERIGFSANQLQASIHSAKLTGTLANGGLALSKVEGLVDTREYLPLLGPGPDDALCSMMPAMGDCQACADGAARCWPVSFADGAPTKVDLTVTSRTQAEVCADPACASALACHP